MAATVTVSHFDEAGGLIVRNSALVAEFRPVVSEDSRLDREDKAASIAGFASRLFPGM